MEVSRSWSLVLASRLRAWMSLTFVHPRSKYSFASSANTRRRKLADPQRE